MKRTVSSILCLIMVMSLCFGLVACGSKPEAPATTEAATTAAASEETAAATEETTEAAEETTEAAADAADEDGVVILEDGKTYGEGATSFTFVVTDKDKDTVTVTVNTDEQTVGAALVALNLVSGSTSEYGLMVDTVNGITLDYNKDGMYWSFYINGEYAMTGVDAHPRRSRCNLLLRCYRCIIKPNPFQAPEKSGAFLTSRKGLAGFLTGFRLCKD